MECLGGSVVCVGALLVWGLRELSTKEWKVNGRESGKNTAVEVLVNSKFDKGEPRKFMVRGVDPHWQILRYGELMPS